MNTKFFDINSIRNLYESRVFSDEVYGSVDRNDDTDAEQSQARSAHRGAHQLRTNGSTPRWPEWTGGKNAYTT